MWESMILTSRGGNPARRIFIYAVTAFVAAFLWILFVSPSAHAADASWSGSDITYSGQDYVPVQSTSSSKPSLPSGTTYYQHLSLNSNGGQAYTIYFPGGNNSTSSSAQYTVYNLDNNGNFGNQVSSSTITITPQSSLSTTTDATWNNGNISYGGNTFAGQNGSPFTSTGTSPPIASGALYYQHLDLGSSKASIIYFASGTTPTTATSATYQTFDINVDAAGSTTWSNASTTKTISVTPINGTSSTAAGGTTNGSSATSCSIEGIGWIVCPVSNFLAWGMDHIFDMLKGFLVVKPLVTQTDNSLYKAWNYIRSIANVAFVIAFLVIIYSQITNIGISNYSIKKLLPRLIIAAILVNISYFICAIAVDTSNIIGGSLQEILSGIQQNLAGPNTNSVASWQSVTGFVLSGGTIAAAAGVGIATTVISTGASVGAAVILLLPMLLSLILAILVALVVLAARQALIVILIIAAPLAFVAYLLPNTEKWFERWRKTLFTLLVFYPIFSLIFGGSQLAGFLIMQNADQINIILLGMFVQVAPLVLTPLLIRFSGDIVGKVAGIVNNPKKGLLDRTKNWAQDRSQNLAARNLSRTDPVRNRQIFRRYALGADYRRRAREGNKAMYTARSDARWAGTEEFRNIDQQQRFANDQKSQAESVSELQYSRTKLTAGAVRNLDIEIHNVKVDLDTAKVQAETNWDSNHDPLITQRRLAQRVANDAHAAVKSTHDAEYEEFKAGRVGHLPATADVARMLNQAQDDTRLIALNSMRNSLAKQIQLENRNTQLQANNPYDRIDGRLLRTYAGGIHPQGAERALALALTEQHKARAESIANANAIIEHSNMNAEETLRIAQNISVKGVIVSDDIREAAIKRVASNGHIPSIIQLLEDPSFDISPNGNENFRITLVDALRNNTNRPKFIGAGIMDQLTQGIQGDVTKSTLDTWIQNMIIDGKLSAKELASQDKDTLQRVNEAIRDLPRSPAFNVALRGLGQEITNLKANDQLWDAAGERKSVINDISHRI